MEDAAARIIENLNANSIYFFQALRLRFLFRKRGVFAFIIKVFGYFKQFRIFDYTGEKIHKICKN
ncbi:hypothetical protein J4760_00105 [Salinicoccus sp. ID82-1]|uniref:hypothetical protein n=1 Tax=Salinicoccus sp. ID82-1 TaxID=2820269 RepID=UPI001F20CD6E|nr:hypothetical protein [Salinicoccus sp. ID82-1]MCG1008444.1 hypothetical protein [Salinicoccus sp. ID82-1]